jgi:hypothetical protein
MDRRLRRRPDTRRITALERDALATGRVPHGLGRHLSAVADAVMEASSPRA